MNAYEATNFKGEIKHIIKTDDKSYIAAALFLDNDRLAVLVAERALEYNYLPSPDYASMYLYLDIYNPVNWERIVHQKINGEALDFMKVITMTITPMRNLLINFYRENKGYFYYLNQDGVEIWNKHFKADKNEVNGRNIFILNDDSIIVRGRGNLMVIGQERVNGYIINPKIPPFPSAHKIYKWDGIIIPYGVKGFIFYNYMRIYIRDDEGEERLIFKTNFEDKSSPSISGVKVVNKEILLYSTDVGNLVVFDITKNKEINSVNLGIYYSFADTIELLPYNRCLLLCHNDATSSMRAKICDLGDLKNSPENEYDFDKSINYKGVFSNGDVPLFSPREDEYLLVYNIVEKTSYRL